MVVEMDSLYPIWWQNIEAPPPAEWVYMFEEFTGGDTAEHWGLAAAIFIAQTRRRTGQGPTFAELFSHLLPDTKGIPGPIPATLQSAERRAAVAGFRGHVAIEWRRRNIISFDKGALRSLRVGREFRDRSRHRQLSRTNGTHPPSRELQFGLSPSVPERDENGTDGHAQRLL
jgi:hypothetical protein